MEENKWRCPKNDYGPENGLDTGDVETFKKEPVLSLAREIGQNSIDANIGVLPTYIQYKLFCLDRNDIPGIEELSEQIEHCYEYKKALPKESKVLRRMMEISKQEKISCLRVSDFNTKGLEGVVSNDREKPFYLLTKGAGMSYKEGATGGSKGIGKFAAFVNSELNTVYYSTYNKDEERGFIGISKLRSAPVPESDGEMTQGIMYYSRNEKKEPILSEVSLDNSFSRDYGVYGTDVYIIAFAEETNWKWVIASKILESFMVAIYKGNLVVDIDDISVKKENLNEIVYSEELASVSGKRMLKDIVAQYELLSSEDVSVVTENILGLGEVEIRVKKYDQEHAEEGTQKCTLVRYPYMKIKTTSTLANVPFSSLCIIQDNELNTLLRNVENPQHTDWEMKRLNDDKPLKKKTKEAEGALMNTIKEFVKSVLIEGSSDTTDVYGAGEYLPSVDEGLFGDEDTQIEETQVVMQPKPTKLASPRKQKTNEDSDVFIFDEGTLVDGGEEGKKPGGEGGDNPNPYDETEEGVFDVQEGKDPILRKVSIGGINYKNIVVDKSTGTYDIVFDSPYDEKECELEIRLYGEGNDTYKVDIIDAEINGVAWEVTNGVIKGFPIEKDRKYKIRYVTGESQLFSSEVIMNAYR